MLGKLKCLWRWLGSSSDEEVIDDALDQIEQMKSQSRTCCVCGKLATREIYRGAWFCDSNACWRKASEAVNSLIRSRR